LAWSGGRSTGTLDDNLPTQRRSATRNAALMTTSAVILDLGRRALVIGLKCFGVVALLTLGALGYFALMHGWRNVWDALGPDEVHELAEGFILVPAAGAAVFLFEQLVEFLIRFLKSEP
jgi:hypothetical protein